MRGVYTASYRIDAVAAAKTLLYLTTPAGVVAEILNAEVTNADIEQNEQLEVTLQRITALGTPTATAVTPGPHEEGDQASVCTVKANVTASEPTYPSAFVTEFGRAGLSSLAGWQHKPTAMEAVRVKPSSSMGLRLLSAPATPFTCVVTLTYLEIG